MKSASKFAAKTFFVVFLCLFLVNTTKADTTPPVTAMTQTPSAPDGKAGWYVSSLLFNLKPTDIESGVASLNYRINSGTWQTINYADTLNLVQNPSFETADAGPTAVANWDVSSSTGTGYTITQDSTNYAPNFGTKSIKIVSTAGIGEWNGVANKTNFCVTSPFDNMTASVWMKTQGVTNNAYYKVYAIKQDTNGVQSYSLLATSAFVTGTTPWTRYDLTFAAAETDAVGVYIDLGLEGTGTVWFDAVTVNSALNMPQFSYNFGTDGSANTFEFYAIDSAGNTEAHNCASTPKINCVAFKLDQTPPGNWHDSGAIRALFGNAHDLWVYTNVEDQMSGISPFTDKYQYFTELNETFGRFSNIFSCSSTWQPNSWVFLITPPFTPGVKSAYIITPRTSFCNSNWRSCKIVKFYSEDVAGNTSTKDFCINGPWIRLRGGGVVAANSNIDMLAEAVGDNTDGLVIASGPNINFFTSSKDDYYRNAPQSPFSTYDDLWEAAPNKTQMTSSDLTATNGVKYYTGNLTLKASNIPSSVESNTINSVIFVSGDLTIDTKIDMEEESTLLFVVKGNVSIAKNVTLVDAAILSDGEFKTAYDVNEGEANSALVLQGVFSANKWTFQRALQGTNKAETPSEDFIYEPKYLIEMKSNFTGQSQIKWEQ